MRILCVLVATLLAATLAEDAPAATPAATPELTGEKFEYQAEVQRLMDIIINSLYTKKEVFLRELISNGSDALDKIRFLSLSNEKLLGEGDNQNLEIRISSDPTARTLTIRDRGVGMTRAELIANLGTIAKSGTANFAEQLGAAAADSSGLIGQFGVGFYSAYLVADRVRVVSKNANDKQYIWESVADNTFTIAEDPAGDTLGRGTEITLFLKEDATEYANPTSLRNLIKRYSEFITFPIHLRDEKKEKVEVPIEEEAEDASKTAAASGDDEEVVAAEEDSEGSADKAKTRTEERTVYTWEVVNDQKAIWNRKPKDVEEEEYVKFFQAITKAKNAEKPRSWLHFSAEGEVEFRSILYIPEEAPNDMFDNYYQKSAALRLYVRKVLISDEFEDLMPRYLNFIRGLVDSDDLPLNVSRENLQQHKILKVIGKKLVRKALEMIRKLANDQKRARAEAKGEAVAAEKSEGGEDGAAADKEPLREGAATAYDEFWKIFGKNIKLGVMEDTSNRSKLAKLLRFRTSSSGKEAFRSLEEYVTDMVKGQKMIYYIAGESYEAVVASPFLERLKAKGIEVLLLTDPIDEYMVQNLPEFDGHRLQSITKEGLTLPGENAATAKKREEAYTAKYAALADFLKAELGSKVEKVAVSARLATSPCILVTSQYGYSSNMERIMKSQAFADPSKAQFMASRKTLEINPRHPIIAALQERTESQGDTPAADTKDIAALLYDTALLNSGFSIEDNAEFSARMYRVMSSGLSLTSTDLLPEIEVEEVPEAADEGEEGGEEEGEEEDGHDEL